jgi:polyphosphate glucokinase
MAKRPAAVKRTSRKRTAASAKKRPPRTLVIDVGGTKVKLLSSGEVEPRRISSGKRMTPTIMVDAIRELAADWQYDVVSIGYPGAVGHHGPRSEPGNLGPGWVGFDYAAAFERPVRIINDAAMQALGSYEGGRMLFLGLGTGLGSTMIAENVIVPLELGKVIHEDDRTLGELLGRRGLKSIGKSAWCKILQRVVEAFTDAFMVDYVVLGGGNAKLVKHPPAGVRLGHNLTAFRGGMRLWDLDGIQTQMPGAAAGPVKQVNPDVWRLV